jgi:acid stress-induced BolA-like protein IbaG/YrbA
MTTVTNSARPQRAGKPRRFRTRPLVITLVVILALLVAADFGAAAIAEYQVSKRARTAFNLTDDPAVTINGFPFLTQAISGDYTHITVDAKGVPIKDILKDVEIHAELRDVRAPLSDLLAGRTDNIVVGDMEAQVRVNQADFNRQLQASNQRVQTADITNVTIGPVSEQRVNASGDADTDPDDEKADQEALKQETDDTTAGMRVGATVEIAGQKVDIAVFAIASLVDGKIQVKAKRVELNGSIGSTLLAPSLQAQVLKLFTPPALDPGTLPVAITPTAVIVEPGAISVKGKAKDVKLHPVAG